MADEVRKPRILIADDERSIRDLLVEFLSTFRFECETVCNGLEALEKIKGDEKFDLLLTDIQMPRLGGIDLALQVRDTPGRAHIPIVFMTGQPADEKHFQAVVESLGVEVLRKPLSLSELVRVIKKKLVLEVDETVPISA